MKFYLLLAVTLALTLPASQAIRPKYLESEGSDLATLRSISQRGSRLLRRLRARQERLSAADGSVELSATLSGRAERELLRSQNKCAKGDKAACMRGPMLMHRAVVLRRAAEKAVAAETLRRQQLADVTSALKIAVRTYPVPSSVPRPEPEPEHEEDYGY